MFLNPFRKSLLAQLVAAFSLLSLVTVSLVSYSAYRQAREGIEDSVYSQLKSAVSLKEYQLIEWLETQQREATVLARSPLVIDAITPLKNGAINPAASSSGTKPALGAIVNPDLTTVQPEVTTTLQNYLKLVTEIEDNLYTIDLLNPDGTIILSNQADRIGEVMPLEKTTYFEAERTNQTTESTTVVPTIYLNAIGVPTITLATPVIDQTGRSLDILLATTPKAETVNHIIRQRAGLGESGEAYLVKTMGGRNLFVAGTPTITGFSIGETTSSPGPSPGPASEVSRPDSSSPDSDNDSSIDAEDTKLSSKAIDQSLQGEDGQGLYQNYRDVPVVGVYRWIDQYEVAILAELDQKEAFRPAFLLAQRIFTVGIVTAGLLLLLIYALARHIIHPVLLMSRAAIALDTNRFQPAMLQSVGDRPDELGQLARIFSRMAERITARQTRLKAKIKQSNERISKLFEHNTAPNTKITAGKQQASDLELAYYDALKRKAAWLRQQALPPGSRDAGEQGRQGSGVQESKGAERRA